MEQDKYYFRVGVFVSLAIIGLIAVLAWLAGSHGSAKYKTYAVYFEGSVDGLSIGSPVKLRGIDIGRVTDIDFVRKHQERIRLHLDIREDAPIHDNLVASVQMKGITGGSIISLDVMRPEDTETAVYYPNKDYPVIKSKPSALDKLMTSMPELMDGLTRMSQQGQKLMSDENIASVSETITAIKSSAQGLEGMTNGQNKEMGKALGELSGTLVEAKSALREMRMLARSLREDPSALLRGNAHKGRKLAPGNPDALEE